MLPSVKTKYLNQQGIWIDDSVRTPVVNSNGERT